jgi:hypothetical protein
VTNQARGTVFLEKRLLHAWVSPIVCVPQQNSPQTFRNLIFLEDYFFASDVEPALAIQLVERVRNFPGMSLAMLKQEQLQVPLNILFALIARSCLYVDLEAAPLIDHEAVLLYPDRATAEAHALLLASRTRT